MPVIKPAAARRPCCPECLRPTVACICACVRSASSAVELLVLQHPLEVANAKGSARLLHMCLAGSRLLVGERFDPDELTGLLYAGKRHPVLLYPDTPDPPSLGMPAAPPLFPALIAEPALVRLVVLDGTWRKSRKMLYQNPALQALPRLALRAMPPSHYRVRKAHAPDQLSTLEAAAYALAQIEGDAERFQPLLAAFDELVDQLALYQTFGRPVDPDPRPA